MKKEKNNNQNNDNFIFKGLSKEDMKKSQIKGKLAASLYNKRKELDMSQKEFAKYLGVKKKTVSKWEKCEYNFPALTLIDVVCKLSLFELFAF